VEGLIRLRHHLAPPFERRHRHDLLFGLLRGVCEILQT